MGRGFESRRDHEKAGKNDNKLPAFFLQKKSAIMAKQTFWRINFLKKQKNMF